MITPTKLSSPQHSTCNKENFIQSIRGNPSSTFHKSIDLKLSSANNLTQENATKEMPSTENTLQNSLSNQQCDSNEKSKLQKQSSFTSLENNSRRFSLFSKTSFATSTSFLFGTRAAFGKSSKSVPKVNICNIFKKKAYLYLDESLAHTFDDLLDKGYSLVNIKKEERDAFKEQEEQMKSEITNLERDIIPLINHQQKTKDQLEHQRELKDKYEEEIETYEKELQDLQEETSQRVEYIHQTHDELTNQIKSYEIQSNEIRSNININKASHKKEMNQLEKTKKQKEVEMEKLVSQLNALKQQFEEKKLSQADRLRKMENKSKMFIGILKH